MRSIEWWHCRWPWVTPKCPKLPQFVHFAPPFIASQRVNLETSIWYIDLPQQVPPCRWEIVPERGVVRVRRSARPDTLRRRPDTKRTCLAVKPTHSPQCNSIWLNSGATPDTTKQSCMCRVWRSGVNWTIAINAFRLQILCRRQSWVVRNSAHTAEADATQTRQFCRVLRGDLN